MKIAVVSLFSRVKLSLQLTIDKLCYYWSSFVYVKTEIYGAFSYLKIIQLYTFEVQNCIFVGFSYYPRVISDAWRGLASQVSAAVTGFQVDGGRKETYFVSGKFYYIFDDEYVSLFSCSSQKICLISLIVKSSDGTAGALSLGNREQLKCILFARQVYSC